MDAVEVAEVAMDTDLVSDESSSEVTSPLEEQLLATNTSTSVTGTDGTTDVAVEGVIDNITAEIMTEVVSETMDSRISQTMTVAGNVPCADRKISLSGVEDDSFIIGPVLPKGFGVSQSENIALETDGVCDTSEKVIELENSNPIADNSQLTHEGYVEGDDLESVQMEPAWVIDYDFTKPELIVEEKKEFSFRENNYLKGCKWSPDGSCLLTCSEDQKLRLFNLPHCLWQKDLTGVGKMDLALTMAEGGLIYDYCWYPSMTSQNPDTCVIACSGRGLPVHLWDAFTGEIRCTYRPYDHVDELISPKTIAFDRTGEKIYCGFEKQIRVFDTSRPGRECHLYSYKSTKKRQVRGQSGIMSCFSFHYDNTMFAVGTYGRTVGLYSTETNKCVQILRGHATGVTQVQFLPNGNHLISGTRKDDDIFCWDIRYHRAPLYRVQRQVKTNQRMQFSIEPTGRYLASGNHDGKVFIWDLNGNPMDDTDILPPICEIGAHFDTANGVDFHSFLPILASSSGQHHSKLPFSFGSDGESESESENDSESDNSVKLWWIGSKSNSEVTESGENVLI